MILTGENRRTRRKTCPSATLSTTNPTRIDPGANPVLRGERPAANYLSHVTALLYMLPGSFVTIAWRTFISRPPDIDVYRIRSHGQPTMGVLSLQVGRWAGASQPSLGFHGRGPMEIGCGAGKDWIRLAQDRDRWRAVVSAVRTFGFLRYNVVYLALRLWNHQAAPKCHN
jgi:hypothetical protein